MQVRWLGHLAVTMAAPYQSELPCKSKSLNESPLGLPTCATWDLTANRFPEFWQRTVYPWMAANNQLAQPRYGISLDDPTITAAEKCRYDAAVEVRGKIVVPGNSQSKTIPGGRYAVTAFRGTADQIGGVWDAILRDWLPDSGMQLDARPFLEYYPTDGSFDSQTGVFTCDIAIPVAPL
jgi:AraC family transcriptional regulator